MLPNASIAAVVPPGAVAPPPDTDVERTVRPAGVPLQNAFLPCTGRDGVHDGDGNRLRQEPVYRAIESFYGLATSVGLEQFAA